MTFMSYQTEIEKIDFFRGPQPSRSRTASLAFRFFSAMETCCSASPQREHYLLKSQSGCGTEASKTPRSLTAAAISTRLDAKIIKSFQPSCRACWTSELRLRTDHR